MGYLTNKLIKTKRLQKLGTSLVLIIPDNWLNEMDWSRQTNLSVAWRPDSQEIIVKKSEKENIEEIDETELEEVEELVNGKEISESQPI